MIEFEVLSKDNIDEVWRLEQECFDDPWTKKMFESEIDNRVSVYIVARDKENERVVGFCGYNGYSGRRRLSPMRFGMRDYALADSNLHRARC